MPFDRRNPRTTTRPAVVTGLLEVIVDRWASCLPIQHPPPSGCIMLDLTHHMRHERALQRHANMGALGVAWRRR